MIVADEVADRAGRARRAGRSATRPRPSLRAALADAIALEIARRRLFSWGAVLFGAGILLFFAIADAPAGPPLLASAAAALAAALLRARFPLFLLFCAIAWIAAGFSAAALRQASVAAPILAIPGSGPVAGFIESLEPRERGARIVLRVVDHGFSLSGEGAFRARVWLRDAGEIATGDYVVGRVRLLPPPQAVRPGGYDFAKEAYFAGIGAVGNALGPLARAEPPLPPGLALAASARLDRLRTDATVRIADLVGGQAGAVAAALLTGKRGLITEETNEALRAAGVYHIVSISGLHMVLVAGTVFFGLRALLALVPTLALGWPIKKIAAACAILAGGLYCVFSGSAVATERAFVMTTIMLGAVILDRPALSMRNLALAALVVLAREPETLVGPSFQMSFSAVAGLIAAAEWAAARRREEAPRPPPGPLERVARAAWLFVFGILTTTLIATLATGPFAAYHFQIANPYGLLGNVLALPIVSILVMPAGVLGMALMPLGLDAPAFVAMGFGVAQVLAVADAVASVPGSRIVVAGFSAGALGALVVALLIATLCVSRLRLLAIAPVLVGLVLAAAPARPDLLVDREGRGVALRAGDGRLVVVGRPGEFTIVEWLRADGDARDPADPSLAAGSACDPLGCVARLPAPPPSLAEREGAVALVLDEAAFAEDCARAAIVVTRLRAPPTCTPPLLIDRATLARSGALAIAFVEDGMRIDTVRRADERRPWLRAHPSP